MKKIFWVLIVFFFPFFVLAVNKVEINTASPEQLVRLTGIGPIKAQAIIDARPFSSVDDLLGVKGIGEKTLQKIKNQGLAYVEGQTQQPDQETSQAQDTNNQNRETQPLEAGPPSTQEQPNTQNLTPAPINYPSGVIFSEILPSPKGADSENEWIELFNKNDFKVNLQGWTIEDKEGRTKTFTINKEIPTKGYIVLSRPETGITLNNSGDTLELKNPSGKITDSVNYGKASAGESYSKIDNNWNWTPILTPGSKNKVVENRPLSTNRKGVSDTDKSSPKKENSFTKEGFSEKGTAEIGKRIPPTTKTPFLTASLIAIASAILILFIKRSFTS